MEVDNLMMEASYGTRSLLGFHKSHLVVGNSLLVDAHPFLGASIHMLEVDKMIFYLLGLHTPLLVADNYLMDGAP